MFPLHASGISVLSSPLVLLSLSPAKEGNDAFVLAYGVNIFLVKMCFQKQNLFSFLNINLLPGADTSSSMEPVSC